MSNRVDFHSIFLWIQSKNFFSIIFLLKRLALKVQRWYIINLPLRCGVEIKKDKKVVDYQNYK